jgi:hypothetical protein
MIPRVANHATTMKPAGSNRQKLFPPVAYLRIHIGRHIPAAREESHIATLALSWIRLVEQDDGIG